MLVRRFDPSLEERLADSAVSIGNFDGVHRGHARLVERLVSGAKRLGVASVILTFEPHPLTVLRPELAPAPITDLKEKIRCFEHLGVEQFWILPFDRALAAMEPNDFLERVLIERLNPKLLVVGHDFNFGKERRGTLEFLQKFCGERGILLEVVPPVMSDGIRVSSTEIRQLLRRGDLRLANQFLGRPYSVEESVIQGDRRGRELGFPTANLDVPGFLPPWGIYRGRAYWSGGEGVAAISAGIRPTFGERLAPRIEVYVLDQEIDLYGKRLRVEFLEWLRPEMKFSGLDALIRQIQADVEQIRNAQAREEAQ